MPKVFISGNFELFKVNNLYAHVSFHLTFLSSSTGGVKSIFLDTLYCSINLSIFQLSFLTGSNTPKS